MYDRSSILRDFGDCMRLLNNARFPDVALPNSMRTDRVMPPRRNAAHITTMASMSFGLIKATREMKRAREGQAGLGRVW